MGNFVGAAGFRLSTFIEASDTFARTTRISIPGESHMSVASGGSARRKIALGMLHLAAEVGPKLTNDEAAKVLALVWGVAADETGFRVPSPLLYSAVELDDDGNDVESAFEVNLRKRFRSRNPDPSETVREIAKLAGATRESALNEVDHAVDWEAVFVACRRALGYETEGHRVE